MHHPSLPTVADVLRMPEVRRGHPRVVAGQGALGNPVRWVHVSELADTAPLLRGGELVLTTGRSGQLPTALVDAIRRRGHRDTRAEACQQPRARVTDAAGGSCAGDQGDPIGQVELRDHEPRSSATAWPKTSVWPSTSASVVAGHIRAMLWKGVSRIPRLTV